ncbi:F-box/RNI-like/FBD-like domains-containing protein [Rhynchospora pubera]|uniref:F-box/RNI-like/FBD-like domains-containing protein n=1 Tax=Rhynchospora pubera TaxID=906938 RepID=A0AAV8F7W9_9POAL|nr:F-box/RNI-like/FBD-like domains-containing protein [Rhynchospora pubera]
MDERDMISSLPDCLIHLIMSFLTAQEAVQTCVLSKRWKNLWTTLPFLDFDLYKFEYDGKSDDSEWDDVELERIKFEKFRDFVNTTLLLRDGSDLHKLHLSLDDLKNDVHKYHMIIRSWILYALKHNIQVLDINFESVAFMPLGVFTCASLVDASLDYPNALNHIKVINLPCLRRLYMHGAELNQDSVDKLLRGCPVLEFLHL